MKVNNFGAMAIFATLLILGLITGNKIVSIIGGGLLSVMIIDLVRYVFSEAK